MLWVYLSIFRSIILSVLILCIRYDDTPYLMFPHIINTIVAGICIPYFIFNYSEHFTSEFAKPAYYLYACVVLLTKVIGYYIIKICPNPAYFRVFISLQIILLFLITLYISGKYDVSPQSLAGLLCGCIAIILISMDKANHK
jgi:drug/metabolite transporter (DMT)-like permease